MKNLYLSVIALLGIAATVSAQSFTNASASLPGTYYSGNVVGITDMDNDGFDDIIIMDDSNHLFIVYQTPNGLEEFDYGVISGSSQWGMTVGDLSNDGHNDVISGGAYDGVHYIRISSPGVYTSETLPNGDIFMQATNCADIDNDGLLDYYACHDDGHSHIWRNTGSGDMQINTSMFDVTNYLHPDYPNTDHSGNYGTVWSDFDDDGDLDMYLAKCRQFINDPFDPRRINQLWVNDGNGNYTEQAEARGLVFYEQSWTADMADYNNDGKFDCLVTNHSTNLMLLENDGNGYFDDITANANLVENAFFLQAKMADFDNDGYVDLIYGGGTNKFFHNNGNGTFSEMNGLFPSGDTMHSFGIGDMNHDGSLDIYATYADGYVDPGNTADILWMNNGNNNNWVVFDLEGIQSNKNAVGAKIKIYGDWGVQVREVRAGESYGIVTAFGCHFGLGASTVIDQVVIEWPSGLETVLEDVQSNQYYSILEADCFIDGLSLSVSGSTQLCSGESVTLSAPAGYDTYSWSNGAETQSITVNQGGNYSCYIYDSEGCVGQAPAVSVTNILPNAPSIVVNGDLIGCEGYAVDLISSQGASYSWNTSEESQSISVTETGTYSVSVTDVCGFTASSESVYIEFFPTPNTPSVTNTSIGAPGDVIINATGNNLAWYDSENAIDPIYVGDNFQTPFLNQTTSFWVEDQFMYGGVESNGAKPSYNQSNGAYHNNSTRWLLFDAYEDLVIKSVKVYAQNAGDRSFAVVDQNGSTIASGTFNLVAGENVVEVDFFVPAGTDLGLKCTDDAPFLWRDDNNGTVNYPYALGTLGSVTQSTATGGSAFTYYYFFYDWVVATPSFTCASPRVEVVVTVVGVEEIEGLNEVHIFPNPADEVMTLQFDFNRNSQVTLKFIDNAGRVVDSQVVSASAGRNSIALNVKDLATGVYNLSLSIDAQQANYRVMVK